MSECVQLKPEELRTSEKELREEARLICPQLTRFRVTTLSFILVLSIVFLVYASTRSGHMSPSALCSLVTSQPVAKVKHSGHPTHTRRHLPQCIIIGVRKGGTRALIRFLNLHPNIQAAGREIHFFDDDTNYSLGYDWYRRKMPYSYSDQIAVEKSPAYFVDERVPERIWQMKRSMNISVSLLLVVRDPVERAISDYTQIIYNKIERGKPYNRFEDIAIEPVSGEVNVHYMAIRRSVYHRHMARWLDFFHLHEMHIVSGEELVRDPAYEIEKVERFLGLDHQVSEDYFYYNETRGFYCIKETMSLEKGSCLAESKGRPHPHIDPIVVQKLRRYFRTHNEKFFRMVQRRFDWHEDGG